MVTYCSNIFKFKHIDERGQLNVTYFGTPFFGQIKQMAVIFIFFDLENTNFRRGMVLYYILV
jgi:hypothetical protein